MKKILGLILCGVLALSITGCGNNESNKVNDNLDNNVEEKEEQNNNDNITLFQKAINQLINAKSVEITYTYESDDLKSDYGIYNNGTLIIDYNNQLVHNNVNYTRVNNYGGSDNDENTYIDLKTNRYYLYDDTCETWYWYQLGKDDDHEIYMYIDYLKELNEKDAKIVSNNYHFAENDKSIDIFLEDDTIKNVTYSISSSNSNIVQKYEFDFDSYDEKTVQLTSEVKNAVNENNLCN